eukprot:1883667-Amphidinium_carterae.1
MTSVQGVLSPAAFTKVQKAETDCRHEAPSKLRMNIEGPVRTLASQVGKLPKSWLCQPLWWGCLNWEMIINDS